VREVLASQQTGEVKKQQKRLAVCNKRAAELDTLFMKIYEDNALGRLPDKQYESLIKTNATAPEYGNGLKKMV
jgi:hypothetical protein